MANGEEAKSYHPQLTWPNIISTLLVVLAMAGGSWTLIQTQLSAMDARFTEIVKGVSEKEVVRHLDLQRRIDELVKTLRLIEAEVDRRAQGAVFVTQPEFKQFLERVNELIFQVRTIDAQRPTVAELQAGINALTARMNGTDTLVKDRVSRSEMQNWLDALRREIDHVAKTLEQHQRQDDLFNSTRRFNPSPSSQP